MDCLPHINKYQLMHLHPLQLIDEQFHNQLLEKSLVLNFDKGDVLFKKNDPRNLSHYLLTGVVELRDSFFSRNRIESCDKAAHYPLHESSSPQASATAKSSVTALVLNSDYIDYLLVRSEAQDNVIDIHKQTMHPVISETECETDWMWSLLQSPLFSKVPPANIQMMFTIFEDVHFSAGETVIQQGDPGDYFYVIKQGRVKIVVDNNEEQAIVRASGDFFGEDALIAETTRSATVTMMQDGLLARLDKEHFRTLLHEAIIQSINEADLHHLKSELKHDCIFLDVRLPAEYKHQHLSDSENIPLNCLRNKLNQFSHDKVYIITADGGRRSELAAHWMNQQGFNTYLIRSECDNKMPVGALRQALRN